MSNTANEVAVIKTTQGEIVVRFWPDVAPKTVENFKKLAREGFYDGTAFHRIVKGFMIQGGDPLTKNTRDEDLWGTGGPGYKVKAEFNDRPHVRGVISMASSQQGVTQSDMQFFIMQGDTTALDGKYAAFGKVVDGMDVVDKIANAPVGESPSMPGEMSAPLTKITIIRATEVAN